jgi:molybdopterin molybdotransferase
VSTGSELVDTAAAPGGSGLELGSSVPVPLDPSRVLESNGMMLAAAAEAAGANVVARAIAGDRRAQWRAALDATAAKADLIVTTVGVSPGRRDLMRDLAGPDSQLRPYRVAMKPGRPQASGFWRGVPVVSLPGNPVAAYLSFLVFVRPALDRLIGRPERSATVQVERGWASPVGTIEFAPMRRGSTGWVRCDRRWVSLAAAEALAVVPAGAASVADGEVLAAIPFG